MERERTTYAPVENLKPKGTLKRRVRNKPWSTCLVTILCGVLVMLLRETVCIIMGAVLVVIGTAVIIAVKNTRILDIYTDGVVVYSKEDDSRAMYLPYKRIAEWSVQRTPSATQAIIFLMPDDTYVYAETFQLLSLRGTLRRFMSGKEFKAPNGMK